MDATPLNLLFWPLSLSLWALVSFLILKFRHFSRFPLLCAYLAYVMLFHASAQLLSMAFGVEAPGYGLFYALFVGINFLFAAALYLRIYTLPGDLSLGRDWHLAAAFILVFLLQAWTNSEPFYKLLNGGNLFCGYLGVATLLRVFMNRHTLHIGSTLGLATIGLLLPSLVYGFVEGNFYFGFGLIELDEVMALGRLTTLAFWLIMAYALSRNEPPRPTRVRRIESKTARMRMWRNAREIWGRSI